MQCEGEAATFLDSSPQVRDALDKAEEEDATEDDLKVVEQALKDRFPSKLVDNLSDRPWSLEVGAHRLYLRPKHLSSLMSKSAIFKKRLDITIHLTSGQPVRRTELQILRCKNRRISAVSTIPWTLSVYGREEVGGGTGAEEGFIAWRIGTQSRLQGSCRTSFVDHVFVATPGTHDRDRDEFTATIVRTYIVSTEDLTCLAKALDEQVDTKGQALYRSVEVQTAQAKTANAKQDQPKDADL
ncbi:hypothetical protein F4819DRAFT_490670 [Hypoxylon fuscum]|nr:hypothetical protein F4819DRAFT_490670 [Hypoxylon fuscum]